MSTSSIGVAGSYLEQAMASALQSAGVTASSPGTSVADLSLPSDSSQVSPLAQLASTLQNLQQSNPAEYSKVTAQIATNLQKAAQTAQSQGNSTTASQLNQLAGDFTTASQTGQLPNFQNLAQASGGSGGHHHHHHHSGGSSATEVAASASPPTSDSSTNPTSTNALSIIQQTLSTASSGS